MRMYTGVASPDLAAMLPQTPLRQRRGTRSITGRSVNYFKMFGSLYTSVLACVYER